MGRDQAQVEDWDVAAAGVVVEVVEGHVLDWDLAGIVSAPVVGQRFPIRQEAHALPSPVLSVAHG